MNLNTSPTPLRRPSSIVRILAVAAMLAATATMLLGTARASYGIFVGNELTFDGSTLLGGTGDEVSSHWLEIVPAQDHAPDATIEVGVTPEANMPGELMEIPQVEHTFKYISMFYSDYEGFPPPLTNGGLNENLVAARDIWSPSRSELVEMTPTPQRGPQYSDLSRIAMERATSARHAVEILGELMDEYGYSTYGGNSHFFADAEEGWVVINFAGGEGLWVAERIGADEVRMSYPGYILEIPENYQEHPDYMGSDNLISFAVEQGWYDPETDGAFNVNEVYGNGQGRAETVQIIEERLRDMAEEGPITLEQFMATVRDPLISADSNGYGQVAHLRPNVRSELGILWVAPTGSITAPFVPWHIGATEVPPEFGKHRYLTKGEATRFVTEDWALQEATQYAYRTFKRLMYYTCDRPEEFLPEVTEALTAFEANRIAEQPRVEGIAEMLYANGEDELAAEYLSEYSGTQAMAGLELGENLLGSIEARTKVQYGIRAPETDEISALDYDAVHCRTD